MTTHTVHLTAAITATQWYGGFTLAVIVVGYALILIGGAVHGCRTRRYYRDY